MMLRALARRSSTGSLTVLGDLAQATTPWATRSWAEALGHLGKPDAHVEQLTRGFRVPGEVIEYAARLLPVIAPGLEPPTSVRRTRGELEIVAAASAVPTISAALDREGSIGVIAPDDLIDSLGASLAGADIRFGVVGRESVPTSESDVETEFDQHLDLVPASLAKGLEFDHVVLVEPEAIVAAEPDRVALGASLELAGVRFGVVGRVRRDVRERRRDRVRPAPRPGPGVPRQGPRVRPRRPRRAGGHRRRRARPGHRPPPAVRLPDPRRHVAGDRARPAVAGGARRSADNSRAQPELLRARRLSDPSRAVRGEVDTDPTRGTHHACHHRRPRVHLRRRSLRVAELDVRVRVRPEDGRDPRPPSRGASNTILLGRKTHEMFAPAWRDRTVEEDPGARSSTTPRSSSSARTSRPRSGRTPRASARTTPTPSAA